jgi:hypothetical protein
MDIYKYNVSCISHVAQKYPHYIYIHHWDGTMGVRESSLFKNLVKKLFWSFSGIARTMLPARRQRRGCSECTQNETTHRQSP